MNATRRSVLQAIPMLAASSALLHRIVRHSAPSSSLLTSYRLRKMAQNESRPILDGLTHSGDHLEVHETTLAREVSHILRTA